MKNRPSLALLEQIVMLLVFAVAAVVCLQAFVWSARTSKSMERQQQALLLAQNTAETLKHTHDCAKAEQSAAQELARQGWVLRIDPAEAGTALLSAAVVEIWDGQTCLAALPVAWQEAADE